MIRVFSHLNTFFKRISSILCEYFYTTWVYWFSFLWKYQPRRYSFKSNDQTGIPQNEEWCSIFIAKGRQLNYFCSILCVDLNLHFKFRKFGIYFSSNQTIVMQYVQNRKINLFLNIMAGMWLISMIQFRYMNWLSLKCKSEKESWKRYCLKIKKI